MGALIRLLISCMWKAVVSYILSYIGEVVSAEGISSPYLSILVGMRGLLLKFVMAEKEVFLIWKNYKSFYYIPIARHLVFTIRSVQ